MLRIERIGLHFMALLFIVAVSACGAPDVSGGFFDPYETQNRRVHEFNKNVDQALLRPVSTAYGGALPEPVRAGIGNIASNLSIPGAVLNDVLQLNIEDAMHNTLRFLVNTTIGLGGIFDPALAAGVEPRDSDFGETLHVWGFPEGAYVEVPFVGPSTTRDTFGMVVDLVVDPLNSLLPLPERYAAPVVSIASRVGDRYRYRGTVDSILYESADSYAQARLFYLDYRRFSLGGADGATDEDAYDIYEETYE
ncbi:MAG: MlaA family lipoprotein [Paracoccaceae bacterium]